MKPPCNAYPEIHLPTVVVPSPLTALAEQESASEPAPPIRLEHFDFLECLHDDGLGEVRHAQSPHGTMHLVHLLPMDTGVPLGPLLARLPRHPGLLPFEAATLQDRVALLQPLWGQSLRERFQECWKAGLPGIPQEELLGYLGALAATLDQLLAKGLAHLALSPTRIRVNDGQTRIAAFGLAQGLGAAPGVLDPRYAAPESFKASPNRCCDQFSLALIYAEMRTGVHPYRRGDGFPGKANLDLALLSGKEREVLQRALSAAPQWRFATATEMVQALAGSEQAPVCLPELSHAFSLAQAARPSGLWSLRFHSLDQFVSELVTLAAEPTLDFPQKIGVTLTQGERLEHHCLLEGPGDGALFETAPFCRQWHARTLHRHGNLTILAINAAPTIWQRLLGRRCGLEVQVKFQPFLYAGVRRSQATVLIKPFGCGPGQAVRLLLEMGPSLLESVRLHLQAQTDQRAVGRRRVRRRLRVSPILESKELAGPIDCYTKDLSHGGIGFFLPGQLPTNQVYVNLPDLDGLADLAGLAHVIRKRPVGDGWFEVGAAFGSAVVGRLS